MNTLVQGHSSAPEAPDVRAQLLDTVESSARIYNAAIHIINLSRSPRDMIEVLPAEQYLEHAQDWLTDARQAAAEQLPVAPGQPRLLMPRLNRRITIDENVNIWKKATSRGTMYVNEKFLTNFTGDQMSGFDESIEAEIGFEIVPVAYDAYRQAKLGEQVETLTKLQEDHPHIAVATIFNGAVLATRNKGHAERRDSSYVRDISLPPIESSQGANDACTVRAVIDTSGNATIAPTPSRDADAARLIVR